jgi:hypothetical protein
VRRGMTHDNVSRLIDGSDRCRARSVDG